MQVSKEFLVLVYQRASTHVTRDCSSPFPIVIAPRTILMAGFFVIVMPVVYPFSFWVLDEYNRSLRDSMRYNINNCLMLPVWG